MRVDSNKINLLLNDLNLIDIEDAIAKNKNCIIYREDLPLLCNLLKGEIETSQLSLEHIEKFIRNNAVAIIDFALSLLNKEHPKSLSAGIAISYSIYMIYIKEKTNIELLNYLKARRIPNAEKLFEQLQKISW